MYPLEGRDFVGHACTLDGHPAIIAGRQLDYAQVLTLDNSLRVEYAWPTVARVMQRKGGRFSS
jgi:hypothetical protein